MDFQLHSIVERITRKMLFRVNCKQWRKRYNFSPKQLSRFVENWLSIDYIIPFLVGHVWPQIMSKNKMPIKNPVKKIETSIMIIKPFVLETSSSSGSCCSLY